MRAIAKYQLWDFDPAALDSSFEKLIGDLGIDGLSVGLVQPTVRAIRRQAGRGPRLLHQSAGMHFHADASCYTASRVKPIAAKWLRHRNPFAQLTRLAADRHLEVHVRIDLSDMSELIERHPWAGTVSLEGESNSTRLCPSNPDVLAFLGGLVDDITRNYPVSRIDLTGAGFAESVQIPSVCSVGPQCSELESFLLAVCFCPSCREFAQRTGVNLDAAIGEYTQALDAQFNRTGSLESSIDACLEVWANLRAYFESSLNARSHQMAHLRERSRVPLALRPLPGTPPERAAVLRGWTDAVVVPDNELSQEKTALHLWQRHWPQISPVEIEVHPAPPEHWNSQSLVKRVMTLCHDGHTTLHFGPMGELAPPSVEWIRQAVRYAKRESVT